MPQPLAAEFFLCTTCGTQYPAPAERPAGGPAGPPAVCVICADERQYFPPGGQAWTTGEGLVRGHRNAFRRLEPGLLGIGTEPAFALGQRALLIESAAGNVLWDCLPLLDQATVDIVRALGGLAAIALSHPHYYSSMVDWAHAFGCPVYVHADDRRWVVRADPALRFWEGERQALPGGLQLVRCGGHFAGSSVLHWPAGAGGRGALLTGDTLHVVEDRAHVSFMRSYPNLIPLPASTIRRIAATVAPLACERVYGAWWTRVIERDGQRAVQASAARYLLWLEDAADAAEPRRLSAR